MVWSLKATTGSMMLDMMYSFRWLSGELTWVDKAVSMDATGSALVKSDSELASMNGDKEVAEEW